MISSLAICKQQHENIWVYIIDYTGCPIKNGTVDFQYIASRKLSIFLRHRIKYFPQKRMTPKSLNLMK